MARKPSEIFTDKEAEIMSIVWELGEATARTIQDNLPGERHYNSVLTIIRVLEKKGHLIHREDGRTFIYRAAQSREKSHKKVVRHMVKQVFGGSAVSLVLNLVDAGELTNEDFDEIRKRVKQREEIVERGKK